MELVNAIEAKDEKLALQLIDLGADVNFKFDDSRVSPVLMFAMSNDLANVVDKMIDKKADINAVNDAKTDAIYYAAFYKMEDIVIKLIDLGVDIQNTQCMGHRTLHLVFGIKKLTKVIDHLKIMYRNVLLNILNDESNDLTNCFLNKIGDLNILDIINNYSKIDLKYYV